MKKGKEKISKKFAEMDSPSNDPSLLSLDGSVQKSLSSKGLSYRWISDITYRRNYGFNKENWKPHKFEDSVSGVDHEGYLRRGDLILATQDSEQVKLKKERIQRKTEAYKSHNREKANELRRLAQDSGIEMQVHEGYEENE